MGRSAESDQSISLIVNMVVTYAWAPLGDRYLRSPPIPHPFLGPRAQNTRSQPDTVHRWTEGQMPDPKCVAPAPWLLCQALLTLPSSMPPSLRLVCQSKLHPPDWLRLIVRRRFFRPTGPSRVSNAWYPFPGTAPVRGFRIPARGTYSKGTAILLAVCR
jgi:hypothetical protein